ncbi:MAG: hypothetical protein ACRCS8_05040 [Brevinema sp.]
MRMPRRLLDTPLKINTVLFVFFTCICTILFLSLSVIKGLEISSLMDVAKNHSSHLNIRHQNFNLNKAHDQSSWWQESDSSLEIIAQEEYVRGITKRTTLPAIITDSQQAIQLTIVDENDHKVFNKNLYPVSDPKIPLNSVIIGATLAQKMGLFQGDIINIEVPSLSKRLPSLVISYVLPTINPFIDNNAVFIDKASLPGLGEIFTDYHIRFRASPYQSLLVSNFAGFLYPNLKNFDTPSTKIEYQLNMLSSLKDSLMQWGLIMYVFFALILFLLHYFHYYYHYNDLKTFAYRNGDLHIKNLYGQLVFRSMSFIFFSSICALVLSFLICLLRIPIPATPFLSKEGLYPELWMSVDYFFRVHIALEDWGLLLIRGLFYSLVGYSTLLIVANKLSEISKQSKETLVGFALVVFLAFGYLATERYFFDISADKGRQKFWDQAYFGQTTIFHKNYPAHAYMNTQKPVFELPKDLERRLISKNASYVASLEIAGFIVKENIDLSNSSSKEFQTPIDIRAVTGNNSRIYNDLIAELNENKVVLGKGMEEILERPLFVRLVIKNIEGTEVTIDIGIDTVIEFPTKELNNSIFVNKDLLDNLIRSTGNPITKLQLLRPSPEANTLINGDIVAQKSHKSYHPWKILTQNILLMNLVKTLFLILLGIGLMVVGLGIASVYNKNLCKYYYIWGYSYFPFIKTYWSLILSMLFGMLIAKCKNLLHLIYLTPIPKFLQLKGFMPNELQFGFVWIEPLLTLLITLIMAFMGHLLLKKLIRYTTHELMLKDFKNKIS